MPRAPIHVLNVNDEIEPIPVPDSPVPLVRVAFMEEDWHLIMLPVLASRIVITPDFAETAPPGLTVHVVAASVEVAPRVAARTAAEAADENCA
jgi:hypothetical protein